MTLLNPFFGEFGGMYVPQILIPALLQLEKAFVDAKDDPAFVAEFEQARPHADGVRVYLNGGEDLGPILDRVVAAGGTVVMPKTFLREDIGYIGMFSDSEGNIIGLHSMH